MCAFSPCRAGTLCPEKCLSGRENHDEKDILSPLRPAAGAGHTPADRRLPADTGGVRPGTGASSAPLPGTAASESAPDSAAVPPSDQDSESFLLADQSAGAVVSVPRRDYLIGAVAAEMPISWPDEALKAQAIAAHSYALYCRDMPPNLLPAG